MLVLCPEIVLGILSCTKITRRFLKIQVNDTIVIFLKPYLVATLTGLAGENAV